jgi:hypothetical protein
MTTKKDPAGADGDAEKSLGDLIKELSIELGEDYDVNKYKESQRQKKELEEQRYKLSAFPTEMDCTQIFDEVLHCYSVGGQARHYYRYGTIGYCQFPRSKLKTCIFTKFMPQAEREKRIARFYMERLAKIKLEGGSSEDIWSVRKEPLNRPFLQAVSQE